MTYRGKRSRSPCGSSGQPRHGGDRSPLLAGPCARGRARSPRRDVAAVANLSSRMDATGSTGSPESSHGTQCSPSSPSPTACSPASALDDALSVVADFIDLKSPTGAATAAAAPRSQATRPRSSGSPTRTHRAPARGARARLRHHRRTELDLGQAGAADADGVRSCRASPDADRADAAPLAGLAVLSRAASATTRNATGRATTSACTPTPTISERACSRRRRSTSGLTAERATGRRSRGRRRRRASPARIAGVLEPRASRAVLVAAGHGEPPANAGTRPRNPGGLTAERSTCCDSPQGGTRPGRSPIGSTSLRRRPTTTSSTSTARSACPRGRRGALGDAERRRLVTV